MANMRIFQGEDRTTNSFRTFIGVWDDNHPEIIVAEIIDGTFDFKLFDVLDMRLEEMGFKTIITDNSKLILITYSQSTEGAVING